MLDDFDRQLLEEVQRDDTRTGEALAELVPLSPSAIARRLRRMRGEGLIARTIALLSPRLTRERLRAVVLIQLAEHADRPGKERLERRLMAVDEVQLCVEIAGPHDMLVLLDCASMADLTETVEALFSQTSTVRRYETHIVKREVKFAPFVRLTQVES